MFSKSLIVSPISNHWNGVIFRAHLSIFVQSTDLLIGKITDAEYAEVELPDRWDSDLENKTKSFQQWSLNQPFQIHLKNGVIDSLSVDRSVPDGQIHQLKVVINQFQLNINDKSESNDNNVLYHTNEESLFGNCETLYEISTVPEYLTKSNPDSVPLPELKGDGDIIGVTKTRNYSNCDELTDSSSRNKFGDNSTATENSFFLLSGSLKSYSIQSSVTTIKDTIGSESANHRPLALLPTRISNVEASLVSVEENNSHLQFLSKHLVTVGLSVRASPFKSYASDPTSELLYSAPVPSLGNFCCLTY